MRLKIAVLVSIITVASFVHGPSLVLAQNNINTAAQRCALSQSYLNILKKRDLYARVDRLQAYQYIYHRLDVFTRRLEKNEQAGASTMRTHLIAFKTATEKFKAEYEAYDRARDEIVEVKNCSQNLAQFQAKLEAARAKRVALNNEVTTLRQILENDVLTELRTIQQSIGSQT